MRRPLRLAIAVIALLIQGGAVAELREFQLQHRTTEQMITLLTPFLNTDGSATGRGYQLFIRGSRQNLEELEGLIHRLDQPLIQLLITVRQGGDARHLDNETAISGGYRGSDGSITLGERNGAKQQGNQHPIEARIYSTDKQNRANLSQYLRSSEGEWAYIQTGLTLPIPSQSIRQDPGGITVQQGIGYQAINRGFEVRPRLHGQQVTLEIRPYNDRLSRKGGGRIATQSVSTTVSGRLGEWIEVAGSMESRQGTQRSSLYATGRKESQTEQIYLKVEQLP